MLFDTFQLTHYGMRAMNGGEWNDITGYSEETSCDVIRKRIKLHHFSSVDELRKHFDKIGILLLFVCDVVRCYQL